MSNAKHILFLVDACYGGLAATNTRGLSSSTPGFLEKITRYKSRQIITAGGRGEKVIEKAEWGHSAFTLNLLRGLKEWMADINMDGIITGEELGLFLKKKVTIDSDNQQTPQSRRFTSHEGEFVFINDTKVDKTDIEKENKYIRWKSKDHYWISPEDGFVWKSIQNIAPNLPPILIEVTKKPAI